ncbi:MAG TPA: hypothetical protein VNF70_01490 [Pyrinomonadaceae bacterium]|nr:hypothetical protein [Pyrinomonadaceae bacterium]
MMKPHRGAVILAFGILGLVVCQLFGVAAWVMGDNDLKEMRRGYMDPSGRDLTNTGRILGMVATALMAIPVVILVFFLVASIVAR